jgi:hypothetical protein
MDDICGDVMLSSFPTSSPSVSPTILSTLPHDLQCTSDCVDSSPNVSGTCLYVTLLDQFGDGWSSDLSFSYWDLMKTFDPEQVHLDCNCSHMVGCIYASSESDNTFTFSFDTTGPLLPSYFWEIMWTVQIVEAGVWGNKYYGGFNTTMSFDYNSTTNLYSQPTLSNAWVYPEACDSVSHMNGSSATVGYLSALYGSNESSHFSVASEATGYLKASWYVTDAENQTTLFGYDLPYCAIDGSVTNYLGCIQDGSYIFRSTGICDSRSSNYSWSFCGQSGGAQEEFQFTVSNGVCASSGARRTNEISISSPPALEPLELRPEQNSESVTLTSFDLKDSSSLQSPLLSDSRFALVVLTVVGVLVLGLVGVRALSKPQTTRETRSPSHPL